LLNVYETGGRPQPSGKGKAQARGMKEAAGAVQPLLT
jgi:hypothetical protein